MLPSSDPKPKESIVPISRRAIVPSFDQHAPLALPRAHVRQRERELRGSFGPDLVAGRKLDVDVLGVWRELEVCAHLHR